ncbi:MAG: permease prefix domain 1-containing protein [Anaerolineae bacterium]|nr:permease prefix domain 1-containing protein [Anaerolineae bacterium]
MTMNANEMIERYVHEVGRQLPRKGRSDIERELRSLLQDAVDERAGDGQPTEQTATKVLLDFGPPEQMAAQYHATQYVIGPQLYPFYRFVATIVLSVMAVLYLVLMILTLVTGDSADTASVIWNFLLEFAQAAVISLGVITLIFAGIERVWGGELVSDSNSAEWDPYDLPPVDDPDRINRFEQVAGIIATIVFVGIFLVLIRPDGVLAPFIAPGFRSVIPLIIVSTAIEVMLKFIVVWQGRWTRMTRTLEIGSELFGLYVLVQILTVGAITTIDFLNWVIRLALFVALVVDAIGIVVKVVKLIFGRKFRPQWHNAVKPSS